MGCCKSKPRVEQGMDVSMETTQHFLQSLDGYQLTSFMEKVVRGMDAHKIIKMNEMLNRFLDSKCRSVIQTHDIPGPEALVDLKDDDEPGVPRDMIIGHDAIIFDIFVHPNQMYGTHPIRQFQYFYPRTQMEGYAPSSISIVTAAPEYKVVYNDLMDFGMFDKKTGTHVILTEHQQMREKLSQVKDTLTRINEHHPLWVGWDIPKHLVYLKILIPDIEVTFRFFDVKEEYEKKRGNATSLVSAIQTLGWDKFRKCMYRIDSNPHDGVLDARAVAYLYRCLTQDNSKSHG